MKRTRLHLAPGMAMLALAAALVALAPRVAAVPGDLDLSGRVDGEDLVGLARQIGQPISAADALDFDLDRNGAVESADPGLVQRNFGLHGTAPALWVVDDTANVLRKLSPASGRMLAEVSGLTQVKGVAVGANNEAYVAQFNGTIVAADGDLLGSYNIATGTGSHRVLLGFGNNYVHDVNTANGQLWVLNKSLQRLYRVAANAPSNYNVTSSTGYHAVVYNAGSGYIAVDGPRGVVWISISGKIIRLRADAPDGYRLDTGSGYHSTLPVSGVGPISLDPVTGNLWANLSNSQITRVASDGNSYLPNTMIFLSSLQEIAADPKTGGCWFTQFNNTVGLLNSSADAVTMATAGYDRRAQLVPLRHNGLLWFADKNVADLVLLSRQGTELLRRPLSAHFSGADINPLPPDARAPVVDLLVNNTEPSVGSPVTFTADVLDQHEPIVSYYWDFDGDGRPDRTTSTAQTTFAYSRQQAAMPVVEAVDNRGFSGFSGPRTVVPGYLAAVVEATPTAGDLPLDVEFTGRYFDPLGTAQVLNYRYDFDGDGVDDYTSTTEPDTFHEYDAAGTFDAVFKVTFEGGRVSTATVQIRTNQAAPVAVARANPTGGTRPLAVTLYSDESSDADGKILLYQWDFENNGSYDYSATSAQAVPHVYPAEGDYTAKLRVTDNSGLSDTDTVAVRVGPPMPVAVAEATPTRGHAPLPVQFKGDQSHGVGASLVAYEWLFGDGERLLSADGFATQQLFLGSFEATGRDDIDTVEAGVLDASPTADDVLGGMIWRVRNDADGLFNWSNIFGYSNYSYGYSLIYLYAPRAETVQLHYRSQTATRFWVNGARVHAATYGGPLPAAEAAFDAQLAAGWNRLLAACPGNIWEWQLGYRITDSLGQPSPMYYRATRPAGATPAGYYSSTSSPNTNHTYTQPGEYLAQLVVTDEHGLKGSDSVAITVVAATGPLAVAEAIPAQGEAPLPVLLKGSGTVDPNGNITVYKWDFEGGEFSDDAEGQPRFVPEGTWAKSSLGVEPGHGRYLWTDSPGGDYQPNSNASLRSFPVDLSSATTAFLRFWQQYDFGTGDYGYVESSLDGGNTWHTITYYSYTYPYWYEYDINLSSLLGHNLVLIRFRLFSDSNPNTVGDGWRLDDIRIDTGGPSFEYQSATVANTNHTYTLPGYFTPTLEVRDADRFISTASAPLRVLSRPSAELVAPASGAVYRSATLEFVASGFDLDGKVVKYEWDFDADGSYDYSTFQGTLFRHVYAAGGAHTARLRVTDDSGLTTVVETHFTIQARPLTVALTATPSSGNTPLAVLLAAATLPPDRGIVSYRWDVNGDGIDDVIDEGLPGRVLDVPSVYNDNWAASHLIDGGTGAKQGWSSSYNSQLPVDIILELHGGHSWMIDRFGIDPRTTGGNASYQPAQCQVLVSANDVSTGYVPVLNFTLTAASQATEFTFPPVAARYVKLRVFSIVSGAYLNIGELWVRSGATDPLRAPSATLSRTYSASGTFYPKVSVRDDDGMTASASTRVDALDPNRVTATLTFLPDQPKTGESVFFSGGGTAPGSTIARFEYDFNNDGAFELVDDTAGTVDSFTKQENASTRKAANLIDGKNTGGFRWGSGAIATPSTEQDFVFHFAGLATKNIDTIAIDPVTDYGVNSQVKDLAVDVSVTSASSGFSSVGTFVLEKTSEVQVFNFTSTAAKWVQLRALNTYGNTTMGMAEFRVHETGTGDNLLSVDGEVVRRFADPGSYPVTLKVVDALARSATAAVIVDVDPAGTEDIHLWLANQDATLFRTDVNGNVEVDVRGFSSTYGVAVDRQRNSVWVSDQSKNQVFVLSRSVPAAGYNITTSTGFHKVLSGFARPSQPLIDPSNGFAWIGDVDRNAIYIIDPTAPDGYDVTNPGPFHRKVSGVNGAYYLDWDTGYDAVWAADYNTKYVYKIDKNVPAGYDVATGTTSHLRYSGFHYPYSIVVDRQRDLIYIAEYYGSRLVQLMGTPPDGYDVDEDAGHHRARTGITNARGLSLDAKLGNVLVCSENGDSVLCVDSRLATIWQQGGFNGPTFTIFNERMGESYLFVAPARKYYRLTLSGAQRASRSSAPNTIGAALDQPDRDPAQDPQVVLAAAPQRGALPLTVNLSAAASDPNGAIARYNWDFEGDGHVDQSATGTNTAQHVYREEGRVFALAEVVDGDGRTARDWKLIGAGEFHLDLVAEPSSGHGSLDVALTALAFSPAGIIRYLWDLDGDGLFEEETGGPDNTVTLNRAGEHVLRVRAEDGSGAMQDASTRVTLVSSPPSLNFSASPRSGVRPLTVDFSANANDADGSVVSFAWDVDGDGVVDRLSPDGTGFDHVYDLVGTVTPTLTVFDDTGLSTTKLVVITINPRATNLVAQATPTKANVGDTVQFDALVDADGPIAQYGWDYNGDGKVDQVSAAGPAMSHVYSATGVYGAVVYATDSLGRIVHDTVVLSIRPAGTPFAVAEAVPDLVHLGFSTQLHAENSHDPGGSITHYRWYLDSELAWIGDNSVGRLVSMAADGSRRQLADYTSDIQGMAVNPQNGDLWVSPGIYQEWRCDRHGRRLTTITGLSPHGVVVDATRGVVWVADYLYSRVLRLSLNVPDGYDINSSTGYHTALGGVSNPGLVGLDQRDGSCWVLDVGGNRRLRKISPDGTQILVTVLGWDGGGSMAVDAQRGTIWLSNRGDSDLFRLNPNVPDGYDVTSSTGFHTTLSSVSQPEAIGVIPDSGEVWVVSAGQHEVVRVNAAGTGVVQRLPKSSDPAALAVLSEDGSVLVADSQDRTIQGYTRGGERFLSSQTVGQVFVMTPALRDHVADGSQPTPVEVAPPVQGDAAYELVVTDNSGLTDRDAASLRVPAGESPVALPAAYPTRGPAPLTVRFTANGYDPDGTLYYLRWDYQNDGTNDYSNQTTGGSDYTYNSPGVYDAVLTVEDRDGNSGQAGVRITVDNPESLSVVARAVPERGSAPLTVLLFAEMGLAPAPLTLFEWDFDGDGAFDYSSPTSPVVLHTYAAAGAYLARLRVTDSGSRRATDTVLVSVTEAGYPTAVAAADPTSGDAPLAVVFTGAGLDSDGTIALYQWDFDGDGAFDYSSPGSGDTAHTYDLPGHYLARLRVTDNDGHTGEDTVEIDVNSGFLAAWNTELFDPLRGQAAQLATALVSPTSMSARILNRQGALVRTLVQNVFRPVGVHLDNWDGRDQQGQLVEPGSYLFVIDYVQNGVAGSFDLSNTGAINYETPSVSYPPNFNPLENRFLYARFVLQHPSDITSYIPPWTGGANFPIRTIYLREPFKSGTVVVVWDGTDDQGRVVAPGDFLQAILAWRLPDNAVIVASRPLISDWRTEPVYLVPGPNPYQSASGEYASTAVQFSLSKQADVDAVVFDQAGIEVAHITRPAAPAGSVVVPWDGRRTSGELVAPGLYHMRVVATVPPGLASRPVNAIIKVVY